MKPLPSLLAFLLLMVLQSCTDKQRAVEEINHPLLFLTVNPADPGDNTSRIEGEILNHARYTKYSHISLQLTYLSAYGINIGTERLSYFPAINPGERGRYSFEIHPPPPPQHKTSKILVEIIHVGMFEE